jgi:membrane-bound metal-dependent hydrolase YbcI (DUF457 family)
MLWGTHIGLPVCGALAIECHSLAKGKGYVFPAWTLPVAAVFGVLPDICNPHISLEDRHQSWSHSIWFLLALLPLCGMVASFFPKSELPRWRTALLCWIAAVLHVAMDAISGGVAWLYPWKPTVIGDYYIPVDQWIWWDAGFILLTWVMVRTRPLALARGIRAAEAGAGAAAEEEQAATDNEAG